MRTVMPLAAALALLAAVPVGAGDKPAPSWGLSSVFTIDAKTSGLIGLCVLRKDEVPIACFGLHKLNGKSRYTYLILLKADPRKKSSGLGASILGGGGVHKADLKITAKFQGRQLQVNYKFEADDKTGALLSESLKVGEKEHKKDGARVFLLDLTAEKPTCRAVKVSLPADVPDLSEKQLSKWGSAVERAIEQLKKKSPEVKKFLQGPRD